MENIVFERDYEEEHRQQDGNDAASAIFEIATDGGFIAAYADAMQVIPKVVVPADKENYEFYFEELADKNEIFESILRNRPDRSFGAVQGREPIPF